MEEILTIWSFCVTIEKVGGGFSYRAAAHNSISSSCAGRWGAKILQAIAQIFPSVVMHLWDLYRTP